MTDLVHVGISLPADLLAQFDRLIAQKGYETRSGAISALNHGGCA
jgi:metal-responsive CopG/Arc/MetJ family transcriptional regulator